MALRGSYGAEIASIPADWPGEHLGPGGWVAYTQTGAAIKDQMGKTDCSTGGSRPAGAAEISSGDYPYFPSAYFAYDAGAGVFYYRIRLDAMPLTSSAETEGTGTGGDPWGNVTYNLLIDTDGDGYKEFTVVLDGDSGGGKNKDISVPPSVNDGDDLKIYFNDLPSQCVTPETVSNNSLTAYGDLVWWGNAATRDAEVPSDPTADGATWNFGRSRLVHHNGSNTTWGRGYFVDFQFPAAVLTDAYNGGAGGTQLVGLDTPLAFGYSTSNSNANPLQKDYASNLCYTASCGARFPYMDIITLRDSLGQAPKIGGMTLSEIDCHASVTVRVAVADTLSVTGGTVDDTINYVLFEYYPDTDGNGVDDDGGEWSSMVVPTGAGPNPDSSGHLAPDGTSPSFNDWGVVWDTSAQSSGQYLIRVTAVDDTGHSASKIVGAYIVDSSGDNCGQGRIFTWVSYADALHAVPSDRFLSVDPDSTVYMNGLFSPLTLYNVGFYGPGYALVGSATATSDGFGSLSASFLVYTLPYGLYHAVVYPAPSSPPPVYDGIYNKTSNPIVADDWFKVYALTLLRNGDVTQLSPQMPPSSEIFVARYPATPSLDADRDLEHPQFSSGARFNHDESDFDFDHSPPLVFYELYGYSGNGLRVSKDEAKIVITYIP